VGVQIVAKCKNIISRENAEKYKEEEVEEDREKAQ
jgi:hypothetical protein